MFSKTNESNQRVATLASDARRPIRTGLLILALGFGGFALWATTAPLDEGVPTPGQIVLEGKRKTVQHLTGGIVAEVLVREGQNVQNGEVLMRLNDVTVRANLDAARQQFYSFTAAAARLRAEQSGASAIDFPDELRQSADPLARQHMEAQRQLFQARRAALATDLAVLNETAVGFEAQIKGFEEQIGYLKQEIAGLRDLAAEGYAPRNQLLQMERQHTDLQTALLRARQGLAEVRMRANQRRSDYRREVDAQLADVMREAAMARERLRAASEELERTVIKAPTHGQVVGLITTTPGTVIGPGHKLMDIVPPDEELVLEVHVAPHLIDRVHVGLPADIMFHSFPNQPQMVIDGKVISVAGDLIADPNPNMPPYYLARVVVTPEGVKKLGANRLQPGMPADVVIKTGERTLLDYLMKPLMRHIHTALTES